MRYKIFRNGMIDIFKQINTKEFLKGAISILLLIILVGASNVYADENIYVPTYEAYKTFTIKFNESIENVKDLDDKITITELATNKIIENELKVINNTLLIHAPEYGYKFNNEYELTIGKISDGKYKLHNEFDYTFRIEDNPYSKENLEIYVEENDVSKEIIEFRNKYNKRRKGLKKLETKYFDVYYPDTELGQEYADEIKIYADTSYAFLAKLFDTQVPVEIHIMDEEEAMSSGMSEGNIRKDEFVTFVYLCDDYTEHHGSIITNMIHEMYHNFFSVTSDRWSSFVDRELDVEKMLIDEGIARMIHTIYTENNFEDLSYNYLSNFSYASFNQDIKDLNWMYRETNYFPQDYEDAIRIVQEGQWWATSYTETLARNYTILNWMEIYKKHGYVKFQDILLNLKEYNNDYKSLIDEVYGIEEFDSNIKPYNH